MGLPNLLNNPFDSKENFEQMWFSHYNHHLQILSAIKTKFSINLQQYQMYPADFENFEQALLNHQNFHDDMNTVLSLNGVDLSSIDLKDKRAKEAWTDQNFSEHRAAALALAI